MKIETGFDGSAIGAQRSNRMSGGLARAARLF
jgi:hypothetical protein